MNSPYIHVIGIGEEGLSGLTSEKMALVEGADLIVGGARHLAMIKTQHNSTEYLVWPSPFAVPVAVIQAYANSKNPAPVVILATGDPLWFGVGNCLQNTFGDQVCIHPYVSAFQLAASRMGWPIETTHILSIHGRPVETIHPFLNPSQRLLVLSEGGETANKIADLLVKSGHPNAHITALCHMGNVAEEERYQARACDWNRALPALNTLAIACCADAPVHPPFGLPDATFEHDGKLTKQSVRAATMARLVPQPGGILWDLGTGCGSVAIEWMRITTMLGGLRGQAICTDKRIDRLDVAMRNAKALGVPSIEFIHGANDQLVHADRQNPDAVFIGGGLSKATVEAVVHKLRPFGRLVCNSVTLESEAILLECFAQYGGHLERICVQTATPIGDFSGWKASMPVLQWSFQK